MTLRQRHPTAGSKTTTTTVIESDSTPTLISNGDDTTTSSSTATTDDDDTTSVSETSNATIIVPLSTSPLDLAPTTSILGLQPTPPSSPLVKPPQSSTHTATASTPVATAAPAARPRARRPTASASVPPRPRPVSGGLSVGFSAAELATQSERRKTWMDEEIIQRKAVRVRAEKEAIRTSDSTLKIVLIVWFLIICGIFFHVYRTIQQGVDHNAAAADPEPIRIAASDAILQAFRVEKSRKGYSS